jgi:DNA repair protein RecN (Recombination protein N)
MLEALKISNLAIVEDVEVSFGDGLNVVTGETGAGKSVMVGALGLVLGERADKSMIRAGSEKCSVEATFHFSSPTTINNILEAMGVETCSDGILLIRRMISTSGAGKNVVNDCPVTVQGLKQIGDALVDMHGPHDHQSLLNPEFQLNLLDAFGHLEKERSAYGKTYKELTDLRDRLQKLDCDDREVEQQIDMLEYQVKEIKDAKLTVGEDADIEQEHVTVANAQQLLELGSSIQAALSGEEGSAFDAAVRARQDLEQMAGIIDRAKEWRDEAESIVVQIQSLAGSIEGEVKSVETNPERLQWIEDRMALVRTLKRKYGSTLEDILKHLQKSTVRLDDLKSRGERIDEIKAEINKVNAKVMASGGKLGEARRKAATKLGEAVTVELRTLGFPHGVLSVEVSDVDPVLSGINAIDFGFAPNVGEPMRSLKAIASSGEISRVMLAIKAVLAEHDSIPILVFDEIDANVGGEMGNAIGEKLAAVAQSHQVLCITHLPQVAAHGKIHLVVDKSVKGERTHVSIEPVEGEQRTEEVARMLGGKDLTSVILKHADELLATTRTG